MWRGRRLVYKSTDPNEWKTSLKELAIFVSLAVLSAAIIFAMRLLLD